MRRLEQINDGTYRTSHDPTTNGLSLTIIDAVAELADGDISEQVAEFTDWVDPDALDRLFRVGSPGDPRHEAGRVHLEIAGIDVTVHADGDIVFERSTPAPP